MEDSIIIRNIEVCCLIGINLEEKINPQPIIINLKLFTSFAKASRSDQIEDTVNYSVLVKSVKEFTSKSRFNLLETMGEKLSEKILEDKKIKEVEIEIIKPNALASERVSIIIKRKN
tara:strand:- start:299 stop:649 length:351 start_codon:yes stop_codon:yes gene_type:complete